MFKKLAWSPLSYYPFWRLPLHFLSFFAVKFFNKWKLDPYIFTYWMIILWLVWVILLWLWNITLWLSIIIFSYFFDLIDWKLARAQNKCNDNAKYLDWLYHSLIPPLMFFSFWVNYWSIIQIICVCIWFIFVHKLYVNNFIYLSVYKIIFQEEEKSKKKENFEWTINAIYESKLWKGLKKKLFKHFGQLFIDSVDVCFWLFFAYIFWVEYIYLIIVLTLNFWVWVYKICTNFLQLKTMEWWKKNIIKK